MKNILLLLLMLSAAYSTQLTDDPAFKTIVGQEQNRDKTVLMLYSATTCPQCAYMKEKVFKDAEVSRFMDQHIVVMEKDINRDDLPDGFNYFGIPTMFFIDKNGKQVDKLIGSLRAKPFLEKLKSVIEK